MAERIRIQHKEFETRTDNIKTACSELTVTTKDVPTNNSCKGITLQDYVNRITNIADLIWWYRILLQVDMSDIVKSANTIEQADREAANVWKVITQ